MIPANAFLKLRRIALHPAEDRRGVHFYATLLHHLLKVAIRYAVFAIPPHTNKDDLGPENGGA